jgi:hypothetical protein
MNNHTYEDILKILEENTKLKKEILQNNEQIKTIETKINKQLSPSNYSKYFNNKIQIPNNFNILYTQLNLCKDLEIIENLVKYIFIHIKNIKYDFLYFLLNTLLLYNNISSFKKILLFGIKNNLKTCNVIENNVTFWNHKISLKNFIFLEINNMLENIEKIEDINEIKKIIQNL